MTGYSRDQLIGTDFAGYFTEPERARIGYQQVYRDGFVRDYELQLRHKDGHFTPVRYNATVYRDDQGAVAGVFAAARDIAALRMAESARRESEARYRVLFEHSPIGIYRTTPDGRILMANPALVQILGYASFEELAQRDLEAEGFEPAYDRQQFKVDLERQGEIRGKESQWRHRDGSLRFVRENALAVRDDAGKTLYYEGTVEDISDRKRAEAELLALRDRLEEQVRARTAELTLVNAQLQEKIEEHRQVEEQLRESEARFRGVFEKATTGMCLTGPDGRFLDVNESLCQMLEYTRAELAATGFAAVTHPDDLPASRECVRSLLAGERETYHFEKRYVKKSGGVVWTDVSTILIRQPPANGAPRYFITHIHDITERRQTEDRVRQLNRELEATVAQLRTVNQELESFSYSVSHDLRAPLRSLDGFSQALLDDCRNRLDAQGQDYLNRVRAASQRMAQLIDDLLKLSRVTRSELNAESVNLTELARSVMQEIRQANPRPPTPDPEPTVTIAPGLQANGDARLLRILLANLLGNAWKFTSRRTDAAIEFGQISAQEHKRASAQGISPSAQSAGRQPLLTNHYSPLTTFYVRDNGAGFDMAYVGKLFAPFQRLHGIEEFPGSGIGLATAQRIVLRHGGRIWAEGAPGKGASFFFTLGERPTSASQQAARSVAGFNLK
jgi:PAS domain S-box-containing protein